MNQPMLTNKLHYLSAKAWCQSGVRGNGRANGLADMTAVKIGGAMGRADILGGIREVG